MDEFFSKSFFDKWTENPTPAIKQLFDSENQFLIDSVEKNSTVLDVGCGHGRHIKLIADKCQKIDGIDNNPTMIEKAKNNLKNIPNAKVFLEDSQNIHFGNGYFDVVICMTNTFGTFLDKKPKILQEMKTSPKK